MEWFDPWWSTDDQDNHFHETFRNQLRLEVGPLIRCSGYALALSVEATETTPCLKFWTDRGEWPSST